MASGFSHSTGLPASIAASTCSRWNCPGLAISTASTSSAAMTSSGVATPREPGVDPALVPGAAPPGRLGVGRDVPGALRLGAGHHVEVVHVVPGCRRAGAVPAVRDQDGVPAPDLGEDIDRLVLPARGGLME